MSENIPLPTLLLIEDNEDDIFIFERAYRRSGHQYPVQIVRDGLEAMNYLAGRECYADRAKFPLPFLILLDLKLPLHGGLDVLEWMRQQPALAGLPVVVLTSSAELRDIIRAHRLKARAYLVKPPSADTLKILPQALDPANGIKIPGDRFGDLANACARASAVLRAWLFGGAPAATIPPELALSRPAG